MTANNKQILILGAGYAGMMTAVRLAGKAGRAHADITIVNAIEDFVERPRLHEQATGTRIDSRPITRMLKGTGVRFVQGRVTAIDPGLKQVRVEQQEGERLYAYDYLVLALGSRVDRWAVPGVDEHAYTLDPYGSQTAEALETRLAELATRPFGAVVVGGGATGVEAAAEIKGRYPNAEVSIVTHGRVGAFKGRKIEAHVRQALAEQSITSVEHARVVRVEQDRLVLENGGQPADLIVWAGGFVASPLARQAGLKTNSRGQVRVDPYLRSVSHPDIYAIGDAADPIEEPGAPWRMSLFTALVSGAQAADNLAAALKGRPLRPLSYAWYGQAIALGPADAVGFSTYPADRPWPIIFRRTLAVRLRAFFIWYLGAALEIERRIPGSFFWNGKSRFEKSRAGKPSAQPREQTN